MLNKETEERYRSMKLSERKQMISEAGELIEYIRAFQADAPKSNFEPCMQHLQELIDFIERTQKALGEISN